MTIAFGPLASSALDLLGDGLAARRHLHPALQRGDHVVGRHLLAVVELDALAQRDRVDQAVLRDRRHALGQHRRHVPVGVEGVQQLVDVLHDRADQIGGRRHRVERLRLADHREVGGAALGGRGECRAGCKRQRRRRGQCDHRHAGAERRVLVAGMRTVDAGAKHDSSFGGMADSDSCYADSALSERQLVCN